MSRGANAEPSQKRLQQGAIHSAHESIQVDMKTYGKRNEKNRENDCCRRKNEDGCN